MKPQNIFAAAAGLVIGYMAFKPKSGAVGNSRGYRSFSPGEPITNEKTARDFFRWLLYKQALNFHPDDSFENYVDQNDQPIYTKATAKKLNKRMNEVFELMGERIYDMGMEEMELYNKRLGNATWDIAKGWQRVAADDWKKIKPGTKRHAKILMTPDGVFYEAHSGLTLKLDSVEEAMKKAAFTDLLERA